MANEHVSDPGTGGPELVQVDVDTVEGWRPVPMSESTGPVELRLLRRFGAESTSLLVRFPAGWARPATGYYAAPELFVVLDGTVQLGDLSFGTATGAFLPAYVTRAEMHTPDGALAWAHFDGQAEFVRSDGRAPTHPPGGPILSFALDDAGEPGHPERIVADHGDGWTTSIVDDPKIVAKGPAEVLVPALRRWMYAGDGADVPALQGSGPVLARRPTAHDRTP